MRLRLPRQKQQNNCNADVRRGESRRGSLACLMGILNHSIENSLRPPWTGDALGVVVEIVAHRVELGGKHLVGTDG